jgi:hypothetical protein
LFRPNDPFTFTSGRLPPVYDADFLPRARRNLMDLCADLIEQRIAGWPRGVLLPSNTCRGKAQKEKLYRELIAAICATVAAGPEVHPRTRPISAVQS